MSQPPRQLVLDWPHAPSYAREDFLEAPGNADAMKAVLAWPSWPSRMLMLVGPSGSGKSHLAAIWARTAAASAASGASLATAQLVALAAAPALLIEDADRIGEAEAALFHLVNLARERGGDVLITARDQPDAWGLKTADLLSRLRLAPIVTLGAPDPTNYPRAAPMFKLFSDRQLAVEAFGRRLHRAAHRALARRRAGGGRDPRPRGAGARRARYKSDGGRVAAR